MESRAPIKFRPTFRGWLLLLLAIYLLWPAWQADDVIAGVLAGVLLALMLFFALGVLVAARRCRRLKAQATVSPQQGERIFSQAPAFLLLSTEPLRVWPFFELLLAAEFAPEFKQTAPQAIHGFSRQRRILRETLRFPQRGEWLIGAIAAQWRDQLQLFRAEWRLPVEHPVKVHPPRALGSTLPILSSCSRSGDESVSQRNRQGEPFDLKRYHPSDGIKKIVWKLYAKSRLLLSRHPEPAMTPEGQVTIFCLAGLADDGLCGEVLAYLDRLTELDLEIWFSCLGAPAGKLAQDPIAAENLLIASVWQSEVKAPATYLAQLQDFNSTVRQSVAAHWERLLIFLSPTRVPDAQAVAALRDLGLSVSAERLQPVFIVTNTKGPFYPERTTGPKWWQRLLWQSPPVAAPQRHCLAEFAAECHRNQWELLHT